MRQALILFYLSILIASCTSSTGESEKKQISVSILPQKYFLEKLVGDEYDINVIIPESNSPAVYEPSPRQISDLSKSIIYFSIGELGFEKAWMEKLQSANPDMKLVNTSKGVSLIMGDEDDHHGHHGVDPHIWMSRGACFQMAINMKTALAAENPDNATIYEKNLSDLQQEISKVDYQIRDMLADLPSRQFLIYHPSLSYYARDYKLEQIAIELHGKEPSLEYIQETIGKASGSGLKNVFVQQQFNTESAETIAQELGGKVILFNPLSLQWDQEIISLTKKILENANLKDEQEAN